MKKRHRSLSSLAGAAFLFGAAISSYGQYSYTESGFTYNQNFNGLNGGAWTNDSTLGGWYLYNSVGSAMSNVVLGDGSGNTGGFYSFGSSGSSDRAFGGVASGNAIFGSPGSGAVAGYIAFAVTNNTSGALNSFELAFSGEQWRNGGNTSAQTMKLEYGFGASFATAVWSAPGGSFDWSSPVNSSSAAAVNGNTSGKVSGLGGMIEGLNWGAGQTLWIRWVEVNDAGNDHGLGIDDFSFSAGAAAPLLSDTVITASEMISLGRVMVNTEKAIVLNNAGSQSATYEIAVTEGPFVSGGSENFSGTIAGSTGDVGISITEAGAQSGSITIHNTATSSAGLGQGNLDPDDTIAISGTAVSNREITASSHDFGNVLDGFTGTFSTTLSTMGSDDENTRVTVTGDSVSGNGITVGSGTSTVFDGADVTTIREVSATFGQSSANPTTVSVDLNTIGEGLAGEQVNSVTVGATANVFQRARFIDVNNETALSTGALATVGNDFADGSGKRAAVRVSSETVSGLGWTVGGNSQTEIGEGDLLSRQMTFDSSGKLNGTHIGSLVLGFNYADETLKGVNTLAPITWTYSATVTGRVASTGVATVLAGNSYAGFGLTNVGTRATEVALLAGTASSTRDITMTFESLSGVTNDSLRVSDIVNLTGTATDLIVLQISFNPADYSEELAVAWLAGNQWVVANAGNNGNTSLGMQYQGFLGSFAEFQAGVIGSGAMADYLGAYGVDASGNAWAIVNHNSEFAVAAVPEPGTYALIAIAGVVFMIFRRRNKLANS